MIQKKIVCAKHSVTQLNKIVLEYTQSVEFHEKALNERVFHVKQIKFTCTSREERVTGTSLTRASFNDRRSFEFHETQTSMCYPTTSGLYSRETNLGKLLLASQDFYQGIVVFVCYILDQDL